MTVREGVWVAGRAKLNLGLAVTGRRSDGYHLLLTLFHALEMQDWVLVTREGSSGRQVARQLAISWTCWPGENGVKRARLVGADAGGWDAARDRCLGTDLVPADERNLANRAVATAAAAVATGPAPARLAVHSIVKSIPAGAGLGGGSADAAAAWRAAERLAVTVAGRQDHKDGEDGEDGEKRAGAARLGADVPFALTGGAALAAGIGENLVRLPALDYPVLLVKPAFPLATVQVFGWYDADLAECQGRETPAPANGEGFNPAAKSREAVLALARVLAAGDGEKRRQRFRRYVAVWGRELPNDLALPVYRRCPDLRAWRERLAASSALAYGLTGSGSALFALAEDAAHLEALWTELSSSRADRGAAPTPALLIATRLWSGRPL